MSSYSQPIANVICMANTEGSSETECMRVDLTSFRWKVMLNAKQVVLDIATVPIALFQVRQARRGSLCMSLSISFQFSYGFTETDPISHRIKA